MRTSEVLNKAADLIEERGWVQGTEGWGLDASQPLCLEGGIAAALGVDIYAHDIAHGSCPAYEAVRAYLDPDTYRVTMFGSDAERLWIWNDRQARTAEEVVSVLRSAAVIEAAREDRDDLIWQSYADNLALA